MHFYGLNAEEYPWYKLISTYIYSRSFKHSVCDTAIDYILTNTLAIGYILRLTRSISGGESSAYATCSQSASLALCEIFFNGFTLYL